MPLTRQHRRIALVTALSAAGLVACGGGDDGPPTTSVSGTVVKGPVTGASVCAYRATAAGKGERLACTTSGAGGSYSLDVQHEGDVVIEASGGSYVDEVSGATRSLAAPMQVVLQARGGSATGTVTPLTSVAYSIASAGAGGISHASYASASTRVADLFQLGSVDIASTVPAVHGQVNAYGRVLRAFARLIADGHAQAGLQSATGLAQLQSAFNAAYAEANGTSVTFHLGGSAPTTGGSGPGSGPAPASGEQCGITVSGSGTVAANGMNVPFTLPPTKICVTGVPAASCSAGNAQLQSIAAAGAVPSGNYSLNYQYSYAPNDCSGAAVTVAAAR